MAVNKVILVGNLGRDPEIRVTSNQTTVCRFSIATTERRKDQAGNWSDHTEWHNIVSFGKTAENCGKYLKKGRQVYVEGKLQTNKWQDKEGKDRYTTEIIALTIQFLGGKQAGSEGMQVETYSDNSGRGAAALASIPSADSLAASAAASEEVSFDDDDIPF